MLVHRGPVRLLRPTVTQGRLAKLPENVQPTSKDVVSWPVKQPIITQRSLPFRPWAERQTARLPGIAGLDWADWILVDDAFAAQMAYRSDLMRQMPDKVFAPGDPAIERELLEALLTHLGPNYTRARDRVTRPDGVMVSLDWSAPLWTAAHLVQQDLCIMEKRGAEHVLSGAALCFPANWRLAEKLDRPMSAIHAPVESYDDWLAARVERAFDMMRPEQPLWRANYLAYGNHGLFQPERKRPETRDEAKWVRVERQSLVKLPKTRAVIFGIHTYVVARDVLSSSQQDAFYEAVENHGAALDHS